MATSLPTAPPPSGGGVDVPDKGLKRNAIGYVSNVVIAVASVAPGYSLAATLGFVVAVAGLQAPAVLIVAFIPMLLIAFGYRYLNRADPDAGTTFSWATRAFGPGTGWVGGWAIVVADVVVMANLAQIASSYTFQLFGADSPSTTAVTVVGVGWIILMGAICLVGVELNALTQKLLLGAEVLILAAFAIVALVKVATGNPPGSVTVHASWFSPFATGSSSGFFEGVLLAVFIYWGWDTGVSINEESEDRHHGPGKAAVVSTLALLLIYVLVSVAAQAYGGAPGLVKHQDDVLSWLGGKIGTPLHTLVILAVLSSAAASTQTTILPTARTTLSMAAHGAIPRVFGRVSPRFHTPDVSTIAMVVASIAWYVVLTILSKNVLTDSIVALGFLIAFYYGLTGFACAWYYRRLLFRDVRTFLLAGVAPVLGGLLLFALFGYAVEQYRQAANVTTTFLGVGTPVWIGCGSLVLGVVLMLVTRLLMPTPFWSRRAETADPAVLAR